MKRIENIAQKVENKGYSEQSLIFYYCSTKFESFQTCETLQWESETYLVGKRVSVYIPCSTAQGGGGSFNDSKTQ